MAADRTPVSEMESLSIVPKIVGPIKTYCPLKRGKSTVIRCNTSGHSVSDFTPLTECPKVLQGIINTTYFIIYTLLRHTCDKIRFTLPARPK